MAGRVEFDGARQRLVLSKLQHRAGLEATDAAAAVGFSYPNYKRYAWGKTPIRPDQYEQFARVYGIAASDLAAELSGVDIYPDLREIAPRDQPENWTFRAALRGHITEDLIERYAPDWEGKPILNQMAAVEAFKQMASDLRDMNTADRAKLRPA